MTDFLRLIDVNAGDFRLKKGQGILHPTVSEVSKRGWREGVGDKQTPKKSQKSSPEICFPSPKGA